VKNRAAPACLNSRPNAVFPPYFCSKWLFWAVTHFEPDICNVQATDFRAWASRCKTYPL
jgi:hypothetical protein